MRKHFLFIAMPLFFLSINSLFGQITMTNQGELVIKDDQLVHIDGHFANQSSFFSNRGDFRLTGNFWNEARVTNPGYGILRFVGGQEQTFFLFDSLAVYDMQIDNSAGLSFTGDHHVDIYSEMDFSDGLLYTNDNSLLAFQDGSSYFNESDFSHINGPTLKLGDEDFMFPIGKGGLLRPSGIANLTEEGTFKSEYFNFAYFDLTTDATLFRASNEEYWDVKIIEGSPDANVRLTYEEGIGDFDNIFDVRIARYDTPWTRIESAFNGGSPPIFASSTRISQFGTFTFAENELAKAVVDLKVFQDEDCGVELNWILPQGSTATRFEVEFSTDSLDFVKIGEVEADSTKSLEFELFQFTDYELHEAPRLYYRIKIIQPSGGSVYFTETVGVENKCVFTNCAIYPNPVSSKANLNFRITSEFNQQIKVRVYDVPGRILFEQELDVKPGENDFEIFTKELNLPSAMYFLHVGPKKSLKFVVIYD